MFGRNHRVWSVLYYEEKKRDSEESAIKYSIERSCYGKLLLWLIDNIQRHVWTTCFDHIPRVSSNLKFQEKMREIITYCE